MPFSFLETSLSDVKLICPQEFKDDRGSFWECFKQSDFIAAGINVNFVQDNCSLSQKGVLRGLHFQAVPKSQGKLVRVLTGSIFDVAVDIRPDSKTYGQWIGEVLTAENKKMLWIPEGFAHGFLALEDNTMIHYKVSGSEYHPSCERSILWNDSDIGIDWPIDSDVLVAEKDKAGLSLKEYELSLVDSEESLHV